jgi:4-oxalmesaconate hydratase
VHRVCSLFPRHFVGVCQLPQAPGVSPANSIAELRRCVQELGFIGCNLNPDPSGGHWSGPPLTDRFWYPLYEAMVELDVPAMIHVSSSCNPNFHATGAHYINGDTSVFMQLLTADLFADFPDLRFIIPHGGGAVPYHWGRYRGLAQDMKRPLLRDYLLKNVFFDTCVYHQPGAELLAKVIPVENILFASETIGAVQGIDPETGHYFDDTRRYIDAIEWLSDADRQRIYEDNARTVYARLTAQLDKQLATEGATI